jgi:hypothetical protein
VGKIVADSCAAFAPTMQEARAPGGEPVSI